MNFNQVAEKPIAVKFVKKYECFGETSRNVSERERYDLYYIWRVYHMSAIQKNKNSKSQKTTKIQFIWSILQTCRSTYESENQKLTSALSKEVLWFISELLQKILTIAEKYFSRKTSQPRIEELQELLSATQY